MRNHAEKRRDMARSVLPSTARKGARSARRHSHKTARRSIRATLHRIRWADHPDDVEAPLDRYRIDQGRTTSSYGDEWLVGARRSADKVGPISRWADAIITRTPELRNGDYWVRHNYFAALLPDTLQGRHALSHIEHLFGPRGDRWWDFDERPSRWAEQRRKAEERTRARRCMLDDVLAAVDARRLNVRIAALTPPLAPTEQWVRTETGTSVRTVYVSLNPWLYRGDSEAWLAGLSGRADEVHAAFDALAQVHAEMFPQRSGS